MTHARPARARIPNTGHWCDREISPLSQRQPVLRIRSTLGVPACATPLISSEVPPPPSPGTEPANVIAFGQERRGGNVRGARTSRGEAGGLASCCTICQCPAKPGARRDLPGGAGCSTPAPSRYPLGPFPSPPSQTPRVACCPLIRSRGSLMYVIYIMYLCGIFLNRLLGGALW